jgi:hypothetical protein
LQSREHRVPSDNPSEVAAADDSRLTNGLTNSPENENAEPSTLSFSAVLAMIASLPLSDAEKADAVRRLMAERDARK